ncbi:hypothetical protein [Olsenella sp. An270]|uniref:hypothetical protein n=1 Tax=Olsenella sp. An270 TaxID=1965615 RepID=UPI00117C6CF3|nr:hypothetical protein [Olsenella sp. An270]
MAVYLEPSEVFRARLRDIVRRKNEGLMDSGSAQDPVPRLSSAQLEELVSELIVAWNWTLDHLDEPEGNQSDGEQLDRLLDDERQYGAAKSLYGKRVSEEPLNLSVLQDAVVSAAFDTCIDALTGSPDWGNACKHAVVGFANAIRRAWAKTRKLEGDQLCVAYVGATVSLGGRPNAVTPLTRREPQQFKLEDLAEAFPVTYRTGDDTPRCAEPRAAAWDCSFLGPGNVCRLEVKRSQDSARWEQDVTEILAGLSGGEYPVFDEISEGTYLYRK